MQTHLKRGKVLLRFHGRNGYSIASQCYIVCTLSFLYSNELQNLPTRNAGVVCVLNNLCSKNKASFMFVCVVVVVVRMYVSMYIPPTVHLCKRVMKLGGPIMPLEISLLTRIQLHLSLQ